MLTQALIRYGAIPEVARFTIDDDAPLSRGDSVVVRTQRGHELGTYLESVSGTLPDDDAFQMVRVARPSDIARAEQLRSECQSEFDDWCQRIRDWGLSLQLLDLERTLDGEKRILYVLSVRGPDCTRLALLAAAGGLGIIDVQPVDASGPVNMPSGGGCGSCGSH